MLEFVNTSFVPGCCGNPDAKRLYDDLLSNYNKLVRPVINVTDALTVKIKLKLSQLIDVVSIPSVLILRCMTSFGYHLQIGFVWSIFNW